MEDKQPANPPTYEEACQLGTYGACGGQRDDEDKTHGPVQSLLEKDTDVVCGGRMEDTGTHCQSQSLLENSQEGDPNQTSFQHYSPPPPYSYSKQQYFGDQTQGHFVCSPPSQGFVPIGYPNTQYGYPAPMQGQPYNHAYAGQPESAAFYPGSGQQPQYYPAQAGGLPDNTHADSAHQSAVFAKGGASGGESHTWNVVMVQPTGVVVGGVVTCPKPPATYLWLACFTCLFCCWPLGCAAILCSYKSRSAIGRADYPTAARKGCLSLKLSAASIALGILLWALFMYKELVNRAH